MHRFIAAIASVAFLGILFAGCGGIGGGNRFEGDWSGFYDGPGTDDGSFFIRIDRDGRGQDFDNVHSEDCDAVGDMGLRISDDGFVDYFMDFPSSQACVPYTVDGQGDLDPISGAWEGPTDVVISTPQGTVDSDYFFFMERDNRGRKPTTAELEARATEMRARVKSPMTQPADPNRRKVFK
jgi:hypothetical protein